jgi:predicted RNA binding protein YcfA (HicA-like mRNA interferase family)
VKPVSGKDFARLLERKGWELRRVNGSHHVYAKAGTVERISVPVHGNTPLKSGRPRHCESFRRRPTGRRRFERQSRVDSPENSWAT